MFGVSRHVFMFFDSGIFAEALIQPEISVFLSWFGILDGEIMQKFEELKKLTDEGRIEAVKEILPNSVAILHKLDPNGNSVLHFLAYCVFCGSTGFFTYLLQFLTEQNLIYLMDIPNKKAETFIDILRATVSFGFFCSELLFCLQTSSIIATVGQARCGDCPIQRFWNCPLTRTWCLETYTLLVKWVSFFFFLMLCQKINGVHSQCNIKTKFPHFHTHTWFQ